VLPIDPNNPDSLKAAMEKLNEFRNKQRAIVAPFWKEDLLEKEKLEISHIAKFIIVFDESIKIIEKRESPDFIIEYKGTPIGLEIERLFNLDEVAKIKSKEALFKKAGAVFENKYSGTNVLANFWVIDGYKFTGKEVEEIADFTYQKIIGANPKNPSYMKEIDVMNHSSVDFNYNEGTYMPMEIPATSLEEAINKKEAKFADYRANTGIDIQWLLLVSSVGSHSYDFEDFNLEKPIESQYNHIYLLEDFDAKVTPLK